MNEREVFEQGIAKNPRDLTVRRVFADWLDEHDEPELADFHRQWTVKKYDDAQKWLQQFADILNQEGGDGYEEEGFTANMSADDILAAMHERVSTGDGGIYLWFDTPDECYDGQSRMWECFELITGQKVTDFIKEDEFFRCAC